MLNKSTNIMKIQDIEQIDTPTEITYRVVKVSGVSGFSGGISCEERNVTKKVISCENNFSMRYNNTVKQFRKTIKTEDGITIRLFWFNGKKCDMGSYIFQPAL